MTRLITLLLILQINFSSSEFNFSFNPSDKPVDIARKGCASFVQKVMEADFKDMDKTQASTQLMMESLRQGCIKGFDIGRAYGEWKAKQ